VLGFTLPTSLAECHCHSCRPACRMHACPHVACVASSLQHAACMPRPHAACMPTCCLHARQHAQRWCARMHAPSACAHVPARAWRIRPFLQCMRLAGGVGAGPKHKASLVFVLRSSTARHLSAKLPLGAELPGSCCLRLSVCLSVLLTGPACRHNKDRYTESRCATPETLASSRSTA